MGDTDIKLVVDGDTPSPSSPSPPLLHFLHFISDLDLTSRSPFISQPHHLVTPLF
jgi:hypothetical protein